MFTQHCEIVILSLAVALELSSFVPTMSFPALCDAHKTKAGPLFDAFEKAAKIIQGWLDHGLYAGHEEMAGAVVTGWAYAGLLERIAAALLEAQGWDLEDLVERTDAVFHGPESLRLDAIAEWERLGPTLKAAGR